MRDNFVKFGIGLVAVLVLVFVGFAVTGYFNQNTHAACVVTDKDRTMNNEGDSNTRVYTENCGTFTVKDSLIKGQFDSADEFGKLNSGETYDLTTVGWRVPFLSMFPNIIDSKQVS